MSIEVKLIVEEINRSQDSTTIVIKAVRSMDQLLIQQLYDKLNRYGIGGSIDDNLADLVK
jgi:hypothetical protein